MHKVATENKTKKKSDERAMTKVKILQCKVGQKKLILITENSLHSLTFKG